MPNKSHHRASYNAVFCQYETEDSLLKKALDLADKKHKLVTEHCDEVYVKRDGQWLPWHRLPVGGNA